MYPTQHPVGVSEFYEAISRAFRVDIPARRDRHRAVSLRAEEPKGAAAVPPREYKVSAVSASRSLFSSAHSELVCHRVECCVAVRVL